MNLREQRIAITGVAGTVGQALLKRVVTLEARAVHGLDINAGELGRMTTQYRGKQRVTFSETDIRDPAGLRAALAGADVVFHAAALKDVSHCEQHPVDAADTNVQGTQNVLDAARRCGAHRLVFTSTDKAVSPTSVMGATKLMGERLVARAQLDAPNGTAYSMVRFGNVLGSSGSVVPLFHRQIRNGGPVTVTDPDMTRFVMCLDDAVSLIMQPVASSLGGDIFLGRMSVLRIDDLAAVLIEEAARQAPGRPRLIQVETIGPRAGEKVFEDLITSEEAPRTIECAGYYVILSEQAMAQGKAPRYDGYLRTGSLTAARSDLVAPMSREVLRENLRAHNLLTGTRPDLAPAASDGLGVA